jgi:hypothetical protein
MLQQSDGIRDFENETIETEVEGFQVAQIVDIGRYQTYQIIMG